jgi:hypothetical protein
MTPPGGSAPVATGPVHRQVKTCRLYASDLGFGMLCNRITGGGLSIRQILGGEPLPGCWQEELPADLQSEYAALQAERIRSGSQGAFWLQTCLHGIDPKTLRVTGEVTFTEEVVWINDGDPVVRLTPGQARLVTIERHEATIPLPTVVTSPTVRPRVDQDVAFRVVNDNQVGPLLFNQPGVGPVQMRARLIHLQVTPQPGAAAVNCPGTGVQVTATDTPASRPQACWTKYTRSSAAQPGQTYAVQAVTSWTVEYSTGGGPWQALATVEKRQTSLQPVTEVQTVVVP